MAAPNESVPESVPHDFIDAEISVAGMKTPADEQALNSALSGLDGIESLTVSVGKVAVEYDPVRINQAAIGEVISRAGFRVGEVASGPASPVADALEPPLASGGESGT